MKPKSNAVSFREIGRRVKAQVWLKSFGIPGFMTVFFVGYFLLLNSPCFQVTVMPLTAIDRLIPYQVGVWPLYVSLWIYVLVPPSLIDSRCELVRYGWWAAGVSLIGFAIFFLWPTAVPPVAEGVAGSSWASIRNVDTTGNSCPSLHVAFAVFSAVWINRFLRKAEGSTLLFALNVIWCLGIVYSTLGTKQHVLLDAIAGALLGFAGAILQARFENSRRERTVPAELDQISPAARKL